jgi:hypothetical protein
MNVKISRKSRCISTLCLKVIFLVFDTMPVFCLVATSTVFRKRRLLFGTYGASERFGLYRHAALHFALM